MGRWDKLLQRLLGGSADHNMSFDDVCGLLTRLGFTQRVRGDHFVFTRPGVKEIINLQPERNGKTKDYQVRQVRDILQSYGLTQLP